ncbi:hypothetical protein [Streptomyces sp. KN37]|uniref:hypothetical protein n=1 Tax=Streptomyces sp. KN37 TaxID=3090667 RepID=UPI002A7556A2|nr:hypothetical protein [Streptomyces sp. KN37]WPO76231.1 hypothetical protein R9806_36755 [Streptomyces sp. KN37]
MKFAVKAAAFVGGMLLTAGAAGSAFASDVASGNGEVDAQPESQEAFVEPGANTIVKRNAPAGEIFAESQTDLSSDSAAERAFGEYYVKGKQYLGEVCGLKKLQKTSGRGKTTLVMTVSKSVSSEVSGESGVSLSAISHALGWKVTKSYTVENQTRFEVPKNKYGYIEAYPLYDKYSFGKYKHGVRKGTGFAMKPVGVCFNQWTSKA